MPIYEYNCLKCGLRFECLVRSNNESIVCPCCNQKDLKRLISTFAFTSKDTEGNITDSSSSGCSSCVSRNCSSCAG